MVNHSKLLNGGYYMSTLVIKDLHVAIDGKEILKGVNLTINTNEIHAVEILVNTNTDIKKLFNTSGTKYREMQLKDKLPNMTEKEQIETLVSDGMLIKRPIVYDGEHLTLGFKEEEFEHIWKSI